MPENQIRSTLTHLHDELSRTEDVDDDLRELLRRVDADIHELLEDDARDAPATDKLMTRVEEVGATFAARHPHTERFFQEIIAALGRMGI